MSEPPPTPISDDDIAIAQAAALLKAAKLKKEAILWSLFINIDPY